MKTMLSLPTDKEVQEVKKELVTAMHNAATELQIRLCTRFVINNGQHKVMGTAFWDEVVDLAKEKGAKIKSYTISEPNPKDQNQRQVTIKFAPGAFQKGKQPYMSIFTNATSDNFEYVLGWLDKFIPLNERDYKQAEQDYATLDEQVAKYKEIIPQIQALADQLPNPKNWHAANLMRVCSELRSLR